jgi:DNA (cytosine-5)-methyltransferase 1
MLIVGRSPGDTIPEFPEYTHNENGSNGLKKFTSVAEVLRKIPRNASQHDIQAAYGRASYHTWNASSIVRCITTNGGDYNCHPSGERAFTLRELAALQGFPHEHFFTGNSAKVIKKQIGNAVPPMIAKIIFNSVRKHLEQADAAEKLEINH